MSAVASEMLFEAVSIQEIEKTYQHGSLPVVIYTVDTTRLENNV